MPELRSGARRGRGAPSNPVVQAEGPSAAGTSRRGRVARSRRAANENRVGRSVEAEEIKLLEERGNLFGGETKGEEEEGGGERRMEDYDSGARSADKPPAAEEGSTAPLPDKVSFSPLKCLPMIRQLL